MKVSNHKLEMFIRYYYNGQINESQIKQYEKRYKKPMEEIIKDYEMLLNKRKL